jgi:hypothetical protein
MTQKGEKKKRNDFYCLVYDLYFDDIQKMREVSPFYPAAKQKRWILVFLYLKERKSGKGHKTKLVVENMRYKKQVFELK